MTHAEKDSIGIIFDMTSFRTPTRFSFVWTKSYFCPHIAECANIAEIFCQKTFGDIAPLYISYNITHVIQILFIVLVIFKHLIWHSLHSIYYKGNALCPTPLKWHLLHFKEWRTGTSQPMRMLQYVAADEKCRSPEKILEKLDS